MEECLTQAVHQRSWFIEETLYLRSDSCAVFVGKHAMQYNNEKVYGENAHLHHA